LPLDLAAIRNLVLLRASSEAMMAAAMMTPRGVLCEDFQGPLKASQQKMEDYQNKDYKH
jgi:hypothetical protein